MPDYAYDVAVTGNLAIVAHGQGLQFADISDPASPVEVSRIDLEGGVRAVVTDGQMAYAAGNGIWVVDLADPAQPAQIGRFKSNGPVHALASNGNVLYAAEVFCEFGLCGSNLLVLDVSRPGKPQQAGIAGVPGATATISIHGDLALVATLEKGLNLVDITRPKKPEVVGTFQALGSAMDVAARPGFVLVTNAAENGLLALDTSRPLTPLPVGALETLRWASGLVLDGGLAYVPAWEDGLRVVDVSDPANMAELGVLSAEAMDGAAFGVDVRRGPSPDQVTAYVAVGSSGLRVLDVGDPANPLELGRLDVPGDLWNVAAMDQAERVYLLAVGGNYENDQRRGVLRAIDATDPANLREVGTLSLLDEAWGVTVAGGIAYVVAAGCSYQECAGSLSLVDVSQPETPHLVSAMDVAGGALGLTVVRDMAYLAAGESGVLLVDVSNPENLELVAQVDTPGSARQVVLDPVIPGVRYVADGAAGLIILQEPGQ
jgi:hypothetical protein